MELEIWDMLPAEQKYSYSQSSQLISQTGCIGHLRGDMDTNGEGFFTSLSLALGLADVVQNRAGGRSLDALFIDEGFGSLSGGVLDKALEVLGQLSEGRRLVGIISHVEQLEECIPQKIRVESGEKGSSLRIEGA